MLSQKNPAKKRKLQLQKKFLLVSLLIIISFGSFVMGYTIVTITMLEQQIKKANQLQINSLHYYLTLLTVMLPIGAIFGCLIAKLAQKQGENKLMMASDVIVILSSMLLIKSLDITNVCIGRFIFGIACGISTSIIPPYLLSIAPQKWKAIIGSFHQLFITIGVGFSFFIGQRLKDLDLFNISHWKSYLFVPILYSTIRLIILFIFQFDNLEKHYENSDTSKLKQFLNIFYNKVDIDEFIAVKKFTKQKDSQEQSGPSIFGINKKIFFICLCLLVLNQLSGINMVISYAKQLFLKLSYLQQESANNYLQLLAIVQVIATLFGGWLTNKYGRKRMVVMGGQMVTLSLFSVFIVYSFSPKSTSLLVFLIVVFTISYSSTLGVIPFIYLGELMNNLSIVNIVFWALSLIGMFISQIMLTKIGVARSFFIYGLITYICVFILSNQMIQSQNKSRKELNNEYLFDNKDESSVNEYKRMGFVQTDNNSLIDVVQ